MQRRRYISADPTTLVFQSGKYMEDEDLASPQKLVDEWFPPTTDEMMDMINNLEHEGIGLKGTGKKMGWSPLHRGRIVIASDAWWVKHGGLKKGMPYDGFQAHWYELERKEKEEAAAKKEAIWKERLAKTFNR